MLQVNYERGTKDSDVFETTELTPLVQVQLLAIAGARTDLAVRHKLYIDIVRNGVPFLPHAPRWNPIDSLSTLSNLHVRALDIVDVVVSKLKRFSSNDVSDIDAMIELGHVTHACLIERFRSAYDEFSYDARAADLSKYVDNLNRVERDMLDVEETKFDLDAIKY